MNMSLDPSPILQAAFGFWKSKVLLTAVEMGLFTKLANNRLTGAELGAELKLHPRGIADFFDARLFKFWNDLPEALRTGRPQNEIKHGQKGMFEELYSDLPRLEQFMGAMTGLSRMNFEAFADKFDFSRFQTLCDVGGATGL